MANRNWITRRVSLDQGLNLAVDPSTSSALIINDAVYKAMEGRVVRAPGTTVVSGVSSVDQLVSDGTNLYYINNTDGSMGSIYQDVDGTIKGRTSDLDPQFCSVEYLTPITDISDELEQSAGATFATYGGIEYCVYHDTAFKEYIIQRNASTGDLISKTELSNIQPRLTDHQYHSMATFLFFDSSLHMFIWTSTGLLRRTYNSSGTLTATTTYTIDIPDHAGSLDKPPFPGNIAYAGQHGGMQYICATRPTNSGTKLKLTFINIDAGTTTDNDVTISAQNDDEQEACLFYNGNFFYTDSSQYLKAIPFTFANPGFTAGSTTTIFDTGGLTPRFQGRLWHTANRLYWCTYSWADESTCNEFQIRSADINGSSYTDVQIEANHAILAGHGYIENNEIIPIVANIGALSGETGTEPVGDIYSFYDERSGPQRRDSGPYNCVNGFSSLAIIDAATKSILYSGLVSEFAITLAPYMPWEDPSDNTLYVPAYTLPSTVADTNDSIIFKDNLNFVVIKITKGLPDTNLFFKDGITYFPGSTGGYAVDGQYIKEHLAWYPKFDTIKDAATSDPDVTDGKHNIICTYMRRIGNIIFRSAPSLSKSVTTSSDEIDFKLITPCFMGVSTSEDDTVVSDRATPAINYEIWKTLVGETATYYKAAAGIILSNSNGSTNDITREDDEVGLSARLYTDQARAYVNPHPSNLLFRANERVFLLNPRNKSQILYSNKLTDNQAVTFNGLCFVDLPEDITAGDFHYGRTLLFTADNIYSFAGEGLNTLAQGADYTTPTKRYDIGCASSSFLARVETSSGGGLVFLYQDKLYMIDRSFNLLDVGQKVEQLLQERTIKKLVYDRGRQLLYLVSADGWLVYSPRYNYWSTWDHVTATLAAYASGRMYIHDGDDLQYFDDTVTAGGGLTTPEPHIRIAAQYLRKKSVDYAFEGCDIYARKRSDCTLQIKYDYDREFNFTDTLSYPLTTANGYADTTQAAEIGSYATGKEGDAAPYRFESSQVDVSSVIIDITAQTISAGHSAGLGVEFNNDVVLHYRPLFHERPSRLSDNKVF